MFFCSICEKSYKNIESAMNCCMDKLKEDKSECPICGKDEIENGVDGLLEHYTVCEGEKKI